MPNFKNYTINENIPIGFTSVYNGTCFEWKFATLVCSEFITLVFNLPDYSLKDVACFGHSNLGFGAIEHYRQLAEQAFIKLQEQYES